MIIAMAGQALASLRCCSVGSAHGTDATCGFSVNTIRHIIFAKENAGRDAAGNRLLAAILRAR